MSNATDATLGNGLNLLTLARNKGVSKEAFDALDQTGLLADLFEASVEGEGIRGLDREAFRKFIGLFPLTPAFRVLQIQTIPKTEELFCLDSFFNAKNEVVRFGCVDPILNKRFQGEFTPAIPAEDPRRLVVSMLSRDAIEKELLSFGLETTLSDIKVLLLRQPNGERGTLLNNGRVNIFFVGCSRIHVSWRDDGWCVFVYSANERGLWLKGCQLFSRYHASLRQSASWS